MRTICADEARTQLPKLPERVIKGERITITKHGIPVAVLGPSKPMRKTKPEKVIAELRRFQDKRSPDGISLREMIEKGRR